MVGFFEIAVVKWVSALDVPPEGQWFKRSSKRFVKVTRDFCLGLYIDVKRLNNAIQTVLCLGLIRPGVGGGGQILNSSPRSLTPRI